MNYINPQELIDLGILQEANRRFFHPLGLALEIDSVNKISIQDHRDDPEGMIFADGVMEYSKYKKFEEFRHQRHSARLEGLNYIIQDPQI